jgi:pimeloyl-ACP methyl ester carboxylesterase
MQNISLRSALVASLIALALQGAIAPAAAQSIQSLKAPTEPLVLRDRGSFYVGGQSVEQSATELGRFGPADRITVNQMYVDYMVPTGQSKAPVVMVHGAGLSGKSYDTTPDGRMGWFEYVVRQGHPAYVVDQVGRARSGFNQAVLNTQSPAQRAALPREIWRFGDRKGVWTNFRFGPNHGKAFEDTQFPVEAVGELAKQSIPDLTSWVPEPNPTYGALAELARDLKGVVIVSHSQSGHFPMEAALIDPQGIRAIVALEPGTCKGKTFSDAQITRLSRIPVLVLYGDHLPLPTQFTTVNWQDRFDDCNAYVNRINAAGGRARIMQTTELGMHGNSHMLMQDRNHLQIADFILEWVAMNATKQ